MLNKIKDVVGVAVGGDGDGPTIIHLHEGRTDVLGDGIGIVDFRDLAVLYVPPHRHFGVHVLRLRHTDGGRPRHRGASVDIPRHCRPLNARDLTIIEKMKTIVSSKHQHTKLESKSD
ncbi:hypothetical protein C1H46_031567 [Malus baccata]|uniref:Uncharacterized protein n=1 Tax=Malus baccata TaxID=106549 RepID=A0A540L8U3_MALBA|nr:hypothetical protein C1H46_031567 [Malus baccata]